MSEIKYNVCDITECDNKADKVGVGMQVKFFTDQTEGRNVKPYLTHQQMDLCDSCYDHTTHTGLYIRAWGAQGHNDFKL